MVLSQVTTVGVRMGGAERSPGPGRAWPGPARLAPAPAWSADLDKSHGEVVAVVGVLDGGGDSGGEQGQALGGRCGERHGVGDRSASSERGRGEGDELLADDGAAA